MEVTERKPQDESNRTEATGSEPAERKPRSGSHRSGSHRMKVTKWNLRNGSHRMKATERKPPDTSSQTQATMQLYDTVALWHDGRSYSSRIMIPSIGGTVTLICF